MPDFPVVFIENMRALLGAEADAFFSALTGESALALRVNPARIGAMEAAAPFVGDPVPWAKGGYYLLHGAKPGAGIAHFAGAFYVQEASAMMPASVLSARPGERVLDLCAAPGGKSTQIAAAMAGAGVLVANEPDFKRAHALLGNIERMGIRNAAVLNETPERLSARFSGYFDAVLVDAPCSGEGMFRREPDSRAEWKENAPAGCARRQAAILAEAAKMVKPGGRMVYSTCTFNALENEGVVRGFLEGHPEFSLVPFALPGLGSCDGRMRVMPHRARGDGQFAALFVRAGDGRTEVRYTPDASVRDAARRFADAFGAFPEGLLPLVRGDALFAVHPELPPLDGLRVLAPGLALARLRPERLEPEHHLAMAGENPCAELDIARARAFLRGEAVEQSVAGWLVATYQNMPLGWGKASGGYLKNHLPKGLRREIGG